MTDGNGLYYMRARFYSPEMKRFVNQDVLVGRVNEGQSLNRFAFVGGKPVSLLDPWGLDGMDLTESMDITELNAATSCVANMTNYIALTGGVCGVIIGGSSGTIVCSPSGPGALGCGATGAIEGAAVGSAVGGVVGTFIGNLVCSSTVDESKGCTKASRYQLIQAGITNEHEFKSEYVGRKHVSQYDIYACKDGSYSY